MKIKILFTGIAIASLLLYSGCKKEDKPSNDQDIVKPTVTSTVSVNYAIGVSLNSATTANFSESMDPLTISASTFTLIQGTTSVPGVVTYSGLSAKFSPAENLSANKLYTATISSGVQDLAGNGLATSFVWSFTTGDTPDIISPTLTSSDPLNNETDVALNKVITISFNEATDPSSINSSTLTLKHGTTSVTGIVTNSGRIASFKPSAILSSNTNYTLTVSTGVKDLAGNSLAANSMVIFTTGSSSRLAPVNLGEAGKYVILGKTAISNISTSKITGDLGLSPAATSYVTGLSLTDATGYATSAQVTGKIFAADMADPTPINLTTAVENMLTAYTDAAGRPSPDFTELGAGNIGGLTLVPGLYKWTSTVTLPSDVTVSGGANDVWIFQISDNLIVSSSVKITLTGGAQAKNIFWQVAGTTTIGTTAHFEGIILSMTGITFQTGASFKGRALAQTAVVLDGNTVLMP
jgi:hypothetical protein